MRPPPPLLRLASLLVAVAVGGHLLMHLQPAHHPGTEHPGAVTAASATGPGHHTAPLATAVPSTDQGGDAGATTTTSHAMMALCAAVLAGTLLIAARCLAHSSPSPIGVTMLRTAAAGTRATTHRCSPSRPPDRIDAGVVLLV